MPPRRIENFMDVDSDSEISGAEEPRRNAKGKAKGKPNDKSKRDKGKSKVSEVSMKLSHYSTT